MFNWGIHDPENIGPWELRTLGTWYPGKIDILPLGIGAGMSYNEVVD